jgi:general stress protein YciG
MPATEQRDQMENQDNQQNRESMDRGFAPASNQEEGSGRNGSSVDRQRGATRGFAAMSQEKQKQIASEGGRAAHKQGVAHEWNSEEARQAGRKGGQTVSQNREHMSEIGRRGGQSSGGRRSRNQQNDENRGA